MSGRTVASRDEPRRVEDGRVFVTMGALMVTLLLEALDQTVVGTAMPRIIATLHGFDRYTWTVTAYVLASTIMLPIAGRLSDLFGRKPFLLTGTAIFLTGSVLCGAAQSINQLIAFRVLQGLGAGIGISLVFASVADIFPEEDRARWQGILGSVYGISSVIGPALGGWLSEHGPLLPLLVTDSSRWRWVFFVNLPLGVLALIALSLSFPASGGESSGHDSPEIDIAGSMLMAAATISLLIGLTLVGEGSQTWESTRVQIVLGLAIVLFAAFVQVERRVCEPVLSLDLLHNRVFAANAGVTFFLWMSLFGMAFYVPLFLQGVLGVSPTSAGLVMTPFSLSIVCGNALAGFVIARIRQYQVAVIGGTAIMGGGIALLAHLPPSVSLTMVAGFAVIAGLGMGILFTATAVVVQTVLPSTQLGSGFGVVRYVGQIGGVLGLALVGTVVNASLAGELRRHVSAATVKHLAAEGVRFAASPQILVSPNFRQTATRIVTGTAAAHVPPGPGHAARVSATVSSDIAVLDQVFKALRLSLAVAIQHGLLAVLVFCGGAIVTAFLVTDMGRRA